METNKELLEATVKGLQDKLEQLQTELNVKTLELKNISKPKINQSTIDVIYDCINDGIHEFDFSDTDNYDFDFELDYDGRVGIQGLEFNNADYIQEPIMKLIENKFNIINDTEDESKSI